MGRSDEVADARGTSGVIIKSFDDKYYLRVYGCSGEFVEYNLRHEDLAVTISSDEMASFYSNEDSNVLDHSPESLGLDVEKD